jgi:hypothetical protein
MNALLKTTVLPYTAARPDPAGIILNQPTAASNVLCGYFCHKRNLQQLHLAADSGMLNKHTSFTG